MNPIINKIKELATTYHPSIIENRNHLHAHPELSFHEHETMKWIGEKLKEYKIDFQSGIAKTGIVAILKGKNPTKKTIALRADIDALPIQEENNISYKSKNAGVMHACGHDVHTASLLGSIRILNDLKDSWEGTIKFIFQPAEEKLPGGASLLIKEGVLKNPDVSHILGQHVMPQLSVGKIGFRSGMYMASSDEIYLTIKGKGGHAAIPESVIDPVVMMANIIISLQQVVSRNANPKTPSVLSFGKVIAQGATNVIPDQVLVEGTFRTMDEKWREEAHEKIKKIATSIAEGMGGFCECKILKGYPVLKNNPELTDRTQNAAIEYIGKENIVELDRWMASEDFAYYSQEIPACFYRLGVRNEEKGIISPVHTSTFNIDEQALEIGAGLMAWLAIQELGQEK